jgi:sugar phosphate isomerase/epimerase
MSISPRKITRRTMLRRTVGVGTLAAMASRFEPLLAAPESRGFKIGACEWSLGAMSPACFDVAKEIGLDGVQVSMGNLDNGIHMTKPEVQKAYLAAAKRTGLAIASLALSEMNQVPLKSDPRAAKWLDQSIDVCKALGITLSMPACFGNGNLDMKATKEIDEFIRVVKAVAPRAEKQGITLALENYLSAKDNMAIIDRIGSPAVKVYYDVGNSTDKGYDIYAEIRELGKHNLLCEFHAKDGSSMLGQEGRIDFKRVRKAMDDAGYCGWIQLESATPNGVVPDYRTQCKFLKAIFPEK